MKPSERVIRIRKKGERQRGEENGKRKCKEDGKEIKRNKEDKRKGERKRDRGGEMV